MFLSSKLDFQVSLDVSKWINVFPSYIFKLTFTNFRGFNAFWWISSIFKKYFSANECKWIPKDLNCALPQPAMISMDQFRATSTNSPTDNPPITNEAFSFGPIASSNQIDFEEDRAGDTSGTEVFFEMKENVCNELLGSWICSNGNKELMKIFRVDCPKI